MSLRHFLLVSVLTPVFAQTSLVQGIREIPAPGIPGMLSLYGDRVFPVAVGGAGGAAREAVAAGSTLGQGRVLAFGHTDYVGPTVINSAWPFLQNCLRWAAGSDQPRIGVLELPTTTTALRERGADAADATWATLANFQVILYRPATPTDAQLAALRDFIAKGGGALVAHTGWGWAQLNPTSDLSRDFPGNRLLAEAGIVWTAGFLSRTTANGYETVNPISPLVHAGRALDAAIAHTNGGPRLTNAQLDQVNGVLTRAAQSIPLEDTTLLPRVEALLTNPDINRVPTETRPLGRDQLLDRLALTFEIRRLKLLPPDAITAHPAAREFPGSVPADAPRLDAASVRTRPGKFGWLSTGLYAAPGERIAVNLPADLVRRGFAIRIGAHTDLLWNLASWKRVPEISFRYPLTAETTVMNNAFGGAIYLDVPQAAANDAAELRISGAVAAPHFILDQTTPEEWIAALRDRPAPWAEIEAPQITVSVPSSVIRKLTNPTGVLQIWDRILTLCADLAQISTARARPERIVPDMQISAGYMHAGYPIMTQLDVIEEFGSEQALAVAGNWGLFHEIGHNHQRAEWTFDGTGEVTVNLFSLYVYEFLCGIPVAQHERGSLAFRQQQMRKYNFAKPNFDLWKSDPFLALTMYIQLQQSFGWDTYKDVFNRYKAMSAAERPQNDNQKRDAWMVTFSQSVGRNLGPFFAAWGIPVSSAARESIAHLPVWMPEEMGL